jgi:hypothetical protein
VFDSYRSQNENFEKLCEYLLFCVWKTEGCRDEFVAETTIMLTPEIQWQRIRLLEEMKSNGDDPNEIDLRSGTERDLLFYLKHQLKWIGKEYDEHNWIRYEQRRGALTGYLESMISPARFLRQDDNWDEQKTFSLKCVELINNLPLVPGILCKDKSRYSEFLGKYPGKNKLNKCFEQLKLPYRINSVQKKYEGVSRKKTCWIIVRI